MECLLKSSLKNVIGSALIKKFLKFLILTKLLDALIEDGKVTSKAFARISRDEKQIAEVQIQSLRREKIK